MHLAKLQTVSLSEIILFLEILKRTVVYCPYTKD